MKLIEETEHPIDRAMRTHPEIFTESAKKFEGEAFEKALSRWAREFPEEAAAYEDSIGKGGTLPMEILDHWDAIEEMAERHPGMDIVEVAYKSLDKVLNIFIRINSGGMSLSYSDLLLSVATAQWKSKDAREEVTEFVDELNAIGDGFAFNKDLVLKSCLVLGDFNDIAFKVDNFNRSNMLQIEQQWDLIISALRNAVTLVSSFGYSRDTLTANNAIIPIAYYLLKKEIPKNFDQASVFASDRKKIKHWLILSLVKRAFGGQPDTVLRPIREILKTNNTEFPLAAIRDKFNGTPKSLEFTDDDVENLLFSRYGDGYTFSTLALLYPTLDLKNKPVSFKKIRLKNELKAWEAASPQDRIRFDEQLPT